MPDTRNHPFGQRGRAGRKLNGASVEADPDADAGDGAQASGAYYAIEGGIPLRGEVRLSGAKNAATKLLVASLLTDDICVMRNMPRGLGDLSITEAVMRALGAEVTWLSDHSVSVRTREISETEVPMALGRKNRLAVLDRGAAAASRGQSRDTRAGWRLHRPPTDQLPSGWLATDGRRHSRRATTITTSIPADCVGPLSSCRSPA